MIPDPQQAIPNQVSPPSNANANPANYQKWYNEGGKFKQDVEEVAVQTARPRGVEHEPVRTGAVEVSAGQIEEVPVNVELEKKPDLAGYIEKVEKEAELAQNVVDDYTQQVLIGPSSSQKPQVTLPLTEEEVQQGLHHKVWEGVRWLAEWCVRQVKMLHGQVKYRQES